MEYNELADFVGLSIVEIYFYENQILFKMSNGSFYEMTNYIDGIVYAQLQIIDIEGDLHTLIGNPLVEVVEIIEGDYDVFDIEYIFKTKENVVKIQWHQRETERGVDLKQISSNDFDLKANELKEIEYKKEGSVLMFK